MKTKGVGKFCVLLVVCLLLTGFSVMRAGVERQHLWKEMHICLDYQASKGCYAVERDAWMGQVEKQVKRMRLRQIDRAEMADAFTDEKVQTIIGINYLDVGEEQQQPDGSIYRPMALRKAYNVVICQGGAVCVMEHDGEQTAETYYQSADTGQMTAWLQNFVVQEGLQESGVLVGFSL